MGAADSFDPGASSAVNAIALQRDGKFLVSGFSGTDVGQAKAQSGASVTAANFRLDVVPSGTINGTDVGLVKSSSGHSV